jgi:L-2-hydroxyglutarate oxidase LhgO
MARREGSRQRSSSVRECRHFDGLQNRCTPQTKITSRARPDQLCAAAVLHGGVYYPTDSLKARMCISGRHALERYAKRCGIPYKQIGKLVVAQNGAQKRKLEELLQQAHANGVTECVMVSGERCKELEPAVRAVAGLHCPVTGIIDSVALMAALREDAEAVRTASLRSLKFACSIEQTTGTDDAIDVLGGTVPQAGAGA